MAREIHTGLSRILGERRKRGPTDWEAMEMALRAALHQGGASALSELLQYEEPKQDDRQRPCPCGHTPAYVSLRSKTVVTALGRAELRRPYYRCGHRGRGQFPVDEELDVSRTRKSPGLRRRLADVGYDAPFQRASPQMKLLAGVAITAQEVERTAEAIGEDIAARPQQEIQKALRWNQPLTLGPPLPIMDVQMDATGVPVVKKETRGRAGRTPGEPAHTRDAKLGWVFTQTTWDEEGFALRDLDSTTSVGAIETAQEFGRRIYLEAWKRGWERAEKKVVRGDGADWIWNIAQEHFSAALPIVDLYPARQHLWELARALHPNQEVKQNRWIMVHPHKLDEGQIEKLLRFLRSIPAPGAELSAKLRTEAHYFASNAERMRYPEFRRQHLFVGSGVIEAGCKTVIGSRLKQSGMFWTVRGANAILALRCCPFNGRFEDYGEARRA